MPTAFTYRGTWTNPITSGASYNWANDTMKSSSLPKDWISGLQLSNSLTSPDYNLVISSGEARSSNDSMDIKLSSSITKNVSAAWSAGTNAGGLLDALPPSGGTLHVWLMKNPSTGAVDVGFSNGTELAGTFAAPSAYSETTVKATSYYSTSYPHLAVDPAQPVTGSYTTSWLSNGGTNQRFHIDLSSPKIIQKVYYENSHHFATSTTRGVSGFTMWGSNSAGSFNTTTWASDGGWVQLPTSVSYLQKHLDGDIPDPQYFDVTNDVAYRYYAFKFTNSYADASYMGLRRLHLFESPTPGQLSPTLPSGYLYKRRIGSIQLDSSNKIIGGQWWGNGQNRTFIYNSPVVLVNSSSQTTAALATLSIPYGVKTKVYLNIYHDANTATYISSPDSVDLAATTGSSPLTTGSYIYLGYKGPFLSNTKAQLRTRTITSGILNLAVVQWEDSL